MEQQTKQYLTNMNFNEIDIKLLFLDIVKYYIPSSDGTDTLNQTEEAIIDLIKKLGFIMNDLYFNVGHRTKQAINQFLIAFFSKYWHLIFDTFLYQYFIGDITKSYDNVNYELLQFFIEEYNYQILHPDVYESLIIIYLSQISDDELMMQSSLILNKLKQYKLIPKNMDNSQKEYLITYAKNRKFYDLEEVIKACK